MKDFETVAWFGIVAPATTPKPILARLNTETVKAIQLPDVNKRLLDGGSTIIGNTPEDADKFLGDEAELMLSRPITPSFWKAGPG